MTYRTFDILSRNTGAYHQSSDYGRHWISCQNQNGERCALQAKASWIVW